MRIEGNYPRHMELKIASNSAVSNVREEKNEERVKELQIAGKELTDAAKEANRRLEIYNRRVEFKIHEKTGDIIIRVMDSNTNEVIREIPPEKIKDMIANLLESIGLLVDERI